MNTLHRRLLDGVLLLPADAAEPLFLNSSAAEIVEALRSPMSTEEVAERLAARHGAPVADLVEPVAEAIAELDARGVVERVP